MKKLLFILLIFTGNFLFAADTADTLDTFINQQIKVEKQLTDNNITLDEKIKLKKIQARDYQEFFLDYALYRDNFSALKNPYKEDIYRLKLQLKSHKHQRKKTLVLKDELLLAQYDIKNSIHNTLNEVLRHTHSKSKEFYKEKVGEELVKHFSKYKPIERKKYSIDDKNASSPIVKSLLKYYNETVYLQYVANTFSAELVENSSHIHRTASLSNSKLFSFLGKLNKSDFGHKTNKYLNKIDLDIAKIILILLIILILILIQKISNFLVKRILLHYKLKEDDIEYINSNITYIFNIITSLIIINLIIVVVFGIDSKSISISKIFAILYIILTAVFLYRITNTIAYIKMERMKKSEALKDEVVNLSIKMINGFIILVAMLAMMKVMGVNLTTVLSGLGIVGAAVAFAAKDSIANIFGSIAILLGDVFEQGDWIETKDVGGTVVEIGLRATTIRTFDNALISVPNFELSNNGLKNWSRRSIGRRIKMNIGLTYESDFNDIKKAIEEIREMLKNHSGIANEHTSYLNSTRQAKLVSIEDFKGIKRTTLVYMDEFAGSSINILVYCFSRTVDWAEWLEVKEDVMFKIADILKQNNLEFAYPTMMIHQASKAEE